MNPNIEEKHNGVVVLKRVESIAGKIDHDCIVINFKDGSFEIFTKEEFLDLFRSE